METLVGILNSLYVFSWITIILMPNVPAILNNNSWKALKASLDSVGAKMIALTVEGSFRAEGSWSVSLAASAISPKDPSCSGEDALTSNAGGDRDHLLLIQTCESVPRHSLLDGRL